MDSKMMRIIWFLAYQVFLIKVILDYNENTFHDNTRMEYIKNFSSID